MIGATSRQYDSGASAGGAWIGAEVRPSIREAPICAAEPVRATSRPNSRPFI